jgi:hypothetical protein
MSTPKRNTARLVPRLSEVIALKLSEQQLEQTNLCARALGLTRSDFIRLWIGVGVAAVKNLRQEIED